jgi:hypothetical protein
METKYPNLNEFFKRNHAERNWATSETVSGVGSELRFTRDLHKNLVSFINKNKVSSLLDLPCGDLNYIKHVIAEIKLERPFGYVGADIATNLIAENIINFPELEFRALNVVSDPLLACDMILVRDCLVHLPTDLVLKALKNLSKTKTKFIAITTFPEHPINVELSALGGWRTLNLCAEPFNLPEPLDIIVENCAEYGGEYKDKSLGVWSPSQIREAISAAASSR